MLAVLFVIVAGLSGWAWFSTGNWGYLLAALGFLAIAPSSYTTPFALGKARRNATSAPRWVGPLSIVGGVLILAGIVLRWLLS
jgi:hypothetical protein